MENEEVATTTKPEVGMGLSQTVVQLLSWAALFGMFIVDKVGRSTTSARFLVWSRICSCRIRKARKHVFW
jgi:hypothetical protein